MTRPRVSLPAGYFEALYASNEDPWNFASSAYERAKYDCTLAALSRERYRCGLEVGCSIGVLTYRLARRCGKLVAVDIADRALEQARARCHAQSNITFVKGRIPFDWPAGNFDLIVLSEIVYYLDTQGVRQLARCVRGSLEDSGTVLLVHWTGLTDYPLSGDQASELFIKALGSRAQMIEQERTEAYRLDCLTFLERGHLERKGQR